MESPETALSEESPLARLERRQDEVLAQLSVLETSVEELIDQFNQRLAREHAPDEQAE